MPEYLSPGVYIEEFEIGAKPIEGVSTSTAGFLGEAERGPTTPRLITSWLQYQRVYGSYFGTDKYLPGAVDGFFKNGGSRCYVCRVVSGIKTYENNELQRNDPATSATFSQDMNKYKNSDGDSFAEFQDRTLSVNSVGEGKWGNNIYVKISKGSFSGLKLHVLYWKKNPPTPDDLKYDDKNKQKVFAFLKKHPPTISEIFDNVSASENSPNYYEKIVNGISNLISISITNTANEGEDALDFIRLQDGNEGEDKIVVGDYLRSDSDTPGKRKGLTAFKEIEDISIVYAPNACAVDDLVSELISHCELLRYRFAIIDAEQGASDTNSDKLNPRDKYPTDHAAFYYPWIKVTNPETGMLQSMPPGGHIAGIYARSDSERGVHKAPANEVVRGASDLEFKIMKGEQEILNPRGINVIRAFPGRGILVWGARTLSSNTLWKYINVRRLFIYVEASIEKGTQWVVFEPNDERLWARVRATITQFLTGVWRSGALMGVTPEEAFFVKCDRSTMTQDDIDNGRLICIIGIAPVKPAEFVIFRIAQWQGSSAATE